MQCKADYMREIKISSRRASALPKTDIDWRAIEYREIDNGVVYDNLILVFGAVASALQLNIATLYWHR